MIGNHSWKILRFIALFFCRNTFRDFSKLLMFWSSIWPSAQKWTSKALESAFEITASVALNSVLLYSVGRRSVHVHTYMHLLGNLQTRNDWGHISMTMTSSTHASSYVHILTASHTCAHMDTYEYSHIMIFLPSTRKVICISMRTWFLLDFIFLGILKFMFCEILWSPRCREK